MGGLTWFSDGQAADPDKRDAVDAWSRVEKQAGQERSGQSLFEHSLVEVDVLFELQPILAEARHYGLTETEGDILAVAALVHDTGKETNEWQRYVRASSPAKSVSHVNPELMRGVVPEVCKALGFDEITEDVQRTMVHCAEFHHKQPGRGDGAVMEALLLAQVPQFEEYSL